MIKGNLALDKELLLAAKKIILTAERLVDKVEGEISTLAAKVDAVVLAPQGAYPTSCYPYYPLDGEEILKYVDACAQGHFDDYLARFLNEG
jgi:hypothetical protein